MIRKLQIKFVVINMTMITVMLCVIFGLVYNFTKANLETESIGMMKSIAVEPFRLGRPNERPGDLRLPYFTLLLDKKGELISTGGGYYDLSDAVLLTDLIAATTESPQDIGTLPEHDLRFCRSVTPMGTILVFADMSSETNTLSNLLRTSLIIGVFSFAVFLLISIFLSHRAIGPIRVAWLEQKRFIADASHELKTPLTVIMTNAELLQGDEYAPQEKTTFSKSILTMSRQMQKLLEKMLELARSDAQQSAVQMEKVDLSRLVMDTAISFEGVFVEKGLAVESSAQPDIFVLGNAPALEHAIDILLDNAQKYSSPGGTTRVQAVRTMQGRCRLLISNPGAQIPREETKKIFQRFYRMDKARSRDGSFGLGLPIAQTIVSQHKGRIWAESHGGMNTFIIELPLLSIKRLQKGASPQ